MDITAKIAQELSISPQQVAAVATLLEDGATIPFIARYRKEAHGSLDEVAIIAIRDRIAQLQELLARKEAIIQSLTERELLTPELAVAVQQAETMSSLEDVYLPFRPKKRTRAMMAREKGLEPLAHFLLEQNTADPHAEAAKFINEEKGVAESETALAGARDIIAEMAAENAEIRSEMRDLFIKKAFAATKVAKGKEEEGAKFRDYFDWQEPASKAAGHRLLAMLRGEKEGILTLHMLPDQDEALSVMHRHLVKNTSPAAEQVRLAIDDSYKRLLAPSMETELINVCRDRAEKEAIQVFAQNLRQLLLAPPLGQKRVMAIDPGFRTGCKVACLDPQGNLLHHDIIYVLSDAQQNDAREKVKKLCATYAIEAIAIGNGTASRETESLIRGLQLPIITVVVSESGASVYSASEVARNEFPDLDLTIRGAISIGRRLMDPLAELVKIDPKAIGVGQYQHDVNQTELKSSLNDVVMSCVNAVGVSLNTASAELLTYVSGLGPSLAKAIVTHREKNGPFTNRKELLKVARLGPKAFQQAAGFLRIPGGKNPLDASAVHPESYPIVETMAKDLHCSLEDLMTNSELRKKITPQKYLTDTCGLPTITDILSELEKPGRDPRDTFEAFAFNEHVTEIDDLEPGMRLPGIVTNVTNFGAFVDIGVHQDGLVHISQISDNYVSDPHTVLQVQQKVTVTVLEVDTARKRISLSLRTTPESGKTSSNTRTSAPNPAGKQHTPPHQKTGKQTNDTTFNNPFAALSQRKPAPRK